MTKKAIKELEGFVSQIFQHFFLFISFFQLLYFIIFSILFLPTTFYPHPHPRPTTSTHDPRHLATLFKRRIPTRRAIYRLFQLNVGTFQKCKNAHACLLRDCLGVSRPFVQGTSPKCIDREGLERRCTGTRQAQILVSLGIASAFDRIPFGIPVAFTLLGPVHTSCFCRAELNS